MLQDARTASDTDRRRFSREEHQLLKSEGGEFVTGNEDAKMRDSVCWLDHVYFQLHDRPVTRSLGRWPRRDTEKDPWLKPRRQPTWRGAFGHGKPGSAAVPPKGDGEEEPARQSGRDGIEYKIAYFGENSLWFAKVLVPPKINMEDSEGAVPWTPWFPPSRRALIPHPPQQPVTWPSHFTLDPTCNAMSEDCWICHCDHFTLNIFACILHKQVVIGSRLLPGVWSWNRGLTSRKRGFKILFVSGRGIKHVIPESPHEHLCRRRLYAPRLRTGGRGQPRS